MTKGDAQDLTWVKTMGVQIVDASAARVVAEIDIGPEHLQTFGLVHGGVYCGLIESAASLGASIVARARGQSPPVGLENHTSFVRSARSGRIRVTATPVRTGRTSQLWEATVHNERDEILATGRVRLASPTPEPSSDVAGKKDDG